MPSMYEPSLRIERTDDDTVTVHAETLVPNGCHRAGEPVPQSPSGPTIPEQRSFELPIYTVEGPCTMAVTTVQHQFTVLPKPGKNHISVTTTLDGEPKEHASIQLDNPDDSNEESST